MVRASLVLISLVAAIASAEPPRLRAGVGFGVGAMVPTLSLAPFVVEARGGVQLGPHVALVADGVLLFAERFEFSPGFVSATPAAAGHVGLLAELTAGRWAFAAGAGLGIGAWSSRVGGLPLGLVRPIFPSATAQGSYRFLTKPEAHRSWALNFKLSAYFPEEALVLCGIVSCEVVPPGTLAVQVVPTLLLSYEWF